MIRCKARAHSIYSDALASHPGDRLRALRSVSDRLAFAERCIGALIVAASGLLLFLVLA